MAQFSTTHQQAQCVLCAYISKSGSRCETVYMPLCPGNSRYPAVAERGNRRSIAGHTNHCRNTRGIDDTSTILSLVPSPRACLASAIPFPYLARNLYSRRLELDDGVSGAFTKKNRRRDRRKSNEIGSRLISERSSCGTSRTRGVMQQCPWHLTTFFIYTHD